MNALIVAKNTFYEIFESKIIINILFIGLLLLIMGFISGEFTYGVPSKVVIEVGLATLSLSSVGIAIFFGVTLLINELKNKTVYFILSRPISRKEFLLGKFIGLSAIIFLNTVLLSSFILSTYYYFNGEFNTMVYIAIGFIYLESISMLLIIIFFSQITSTALSIVYTLAFYFIGNSLSFAKTTFLIKENLFLSKLIDFYSIIVPNLSKINFKKYIFYKYEDIGVNVSFALAYIVCYILVYLTINIILFSKKELS